MNIIESKFQCNLFGVSHLMLWIYWRHPNLGHTRDYILSDLQKVGEDDWKMFSGSFYSSELFGINISGESFVSMKKDFFTSRRKPDEFILLWQTSKAAICLIFYLCDVGRSLVRITVLILNANSQR